MKQLIGKVIILAAVVSNGLLCGAQQEVRLDPAVEGAVRLALGITDRELRPSDLAGLSALAIYGSESVVKCTGLQYAVNLEELEIHGALQVLAPEALTNLTRLRIVRLFNPGFSDLSWLENLRGLEVLELNMLEVYTTEGGRPRGDGLICDLRPLSSLKSLRSLGLSGHRIRDISPLKDLADLTSLDLGYNDIEDLAPLAQLSRLERLSLDGNAIRDLRPLAGLHELRILHLSDNQISDLSPLCEVTSLRRLMLDNNRIDDVSALRHLGELQVLTLSNNRIRDLSPLAHLRKLDQLFLGGNEISDLSPLSGLSEIRILVLWGNRISDIGPLRYLQNIGRLYLQRNLIVDISPLLDLALSGGLRVMCVPSIGPGLLEALVDVTDNPLDLSEGSESMEVIRALQVRGVRVYY